MVTVIVPEELWATAMMPEGIIEHWHAANGEVVAQGQKLATVRIEDALHEITAPRGGRLRQQAAERELVTPGCVLAAVEQV